jgi:hypothetical protein
MTPSDAVDAADWIGPRLHPFAQDVGSVVPTGFEAYARIFHPASRLKGTERVEMRWAEMAEWSGRIVHPEMQFHAIAVPVPGRETRIEAWSQEPRLGTLAEGQTAALVQLLARHTSSSDRCWFCVWDGYGGLFNRSGFQELTSYAGPGRRMRAWWRRIRPRVPKSRPKIGAKRVTLPARDYVLFNGPLSIAIGQREGPNLWWPDDRSWCVASEIDFPYTYVGGPKKLIEEILADPALEALPASLSHGITAFSDTVNAGGFAGFDG